MARSTIPPSSPKQPAEHDHHHHQTHYDRSVHEDGTIIEKTVVEDVITDQPGGGKGKKKNKKVVAKAQAEAVAEVVERTVTETVKETITIPPNSAAVFSAGPESVVPPTTARPPSVIVVPTAKAPSVKPSIIKTRTIIVPNEPAPKILEPIAITQPAPASPALSHHHPEIILNINVPPPPLAQAIVLPPQPKVASIRAPSLLPSPAASVRSMKLPKVLRPKPHQSSVGLVEAVTEVDEDEDSDARILNNGDEVVTKVITTTTTTRQAATPTPPRGPSPAEQYDPFIPIIENDPTYKPAPPVKAKTPPPAPAFPPPAIHEPVHMSDNIPHKTIETTTVETVSYPTKAPSVSVGGSIDTSASTMGGPTTKGVGRAKTALEMVTEGRRSGTKGGLRPIPIVDYTTLIQQTPPPKPKHVLTPPPIILKTPSPSPPAPGVPQTIATLSAHLDLDSRGNEHLHATLRDHTGVKKVDEVVPSGTGIELLKNTGTGVGSEMVLKEKSKRELKDEKKRRKGEEKERERERRKEGVYKPLGEGLGPPKSERYAYPPAPTEIERNAKERYQNRFGGVPQAGPSMGPGGMYGAPAPFPTPGPALFPRPPPLMASRPPMFGPPMMNPMMLNMGMNGGMGMGMGGMGLGGMGMMGMPMGQMGMPYPGGMGLGGMGGMGGMPSGGMMGYGGMGPGGYGQMGRGMYR